MERIESSGGKIRFRDQIMDAFLEFGPADLTVSDLRYGEKHAGRFTAMMPLNGTGMIRAEGSVVLDPLTVRAKVTADSVTARPFAPYLGQFMNATMQSGTFAVNGNASLKQGKGARSYDFKGQCTLSGFRFTDNVLKEEFLRWDRLELRDLDFRSEPPAVTIREIFARRPFLRFVVGPDRISNIQHIMRSDTGAARAAAPNPADTTARRTRTRIGRVTIVDGLMAFGDLTLTPSFTTGIEELNGLILDLSSDQLARADIDLRGKVDRYAPAVISGQINPLSEQASTDVLFSFHNIELTKFSSYSGKFMGYKIDKGKLSVDLRYTLNQRYLKGENKIVIDQLTLGEAVEGPDVTSLPVRLAIALLKDRNGVIDIDLPVEGSIDDPEFSVGPLIWKALTNLMLKLVTAPFALLGSLFGGGEDLDHIHFAVGTDSLAAAEKVKLDSLAKGLQERPALRLDVRGLAVVSLDGRALAERSVNARLGVSSKPTGEQREDLSRVAGLYRKTFGADPMLLVPVLAEGEAPPSDEVRTRQVVSAAYQRLVDSTDVPKEELRALAVSRAEKIRSYVVGTGGIDASRVFFLDVEPAAPAAEGEVRLPLALNAM